MKLLPPITIDDAAFISSNVAEDTHALWAVGTTYNIGDIVYYVAANSHRVYQSLVATNVGHVPLTSPTQWEDIGATNRWSMFDTVVSTQTTNTTSIDAVVEPNGRIDTLVLLNINAASIELKIIDSATSTLLYDQTFSGVSDSGITDMFGYFFEPISRISDFYVTGLPIYYKPKIEVILTDTGNTVACGGVIVGQAKNIGGTQYGASVGITDYSIKSADAFGNFTIVERSYSKTGSFTIFVSNNYIDQLETTLSKYRATPIVYIGTEQYTSTLVYGFYKDFAIHIQYPTYSVATIDVEGLT